MLILTAIVSTLAGRRRYGAHEFYKLFAGVSHSPIAVNNSPGFQHCEVKIGPYGLRRKHASGKYLTIPGNSLPQEEHFTYFALSKRLSHRHTYSTLFHPVS